LQHQTSLTDERIFKIVRKSKIIFGNQKIGFSILFEDF